MYRPCQINSILSREWYILGDTRGLLTSSVGENNKEFPATLLGKGDEKKGSKESPKDPKDEPKADGIPKLLSNSWNCLCWLIIHSLRSCLWPPLSDPKLEFDVIFCVIFLTLDCVVHWCWYRSHSFLPVLIFFYQNWILEEYKIYIISRFDCQNRHWHSSMFCNYSPPSNSFELYISKC